jgi:hypothetical protein
VSQRTFGEVDLLETFTETTLAALSGVGEAIDRYRAARHAALQAPSDLTIDLDDRSHEADDLLATLTVVDRLPAAFADALRILDTGNAELHRALPQLRSTADGHTLAALAYGRVAYPAASDAELLTAAITGVAPSALDRADHHLLDDVPWWGRAASAADGIRLPDPGAAPRWARFARPVKGVAGPAGYGLAGLEQWLADAGEHNLTTGHRLARGATAAGVDGLAAAGVGAAGAAAGLVVGGPVGALGGAVAGAEAGGRAGRAARRSASARAATSWIGARLDALLKTHHDDDYDERLELEPPR